MIKIPEGVKIYSGAHTFKGEAPAKFCPPQLHPDKSTTDKKPAAAAPVKEP